MITYNRLAAIEYAQKWAFRRNPKYSDFTKLGGNCTNFVSQCLIAGGMPMNFSYPLGWFYISLNKRAAAFTGVEYLYNFLTRPKISAGPIAATIDIQSGQIGDIVQLSFDGYSFSHTAIIVQTSGNNTHDVFGAPLSSYYYKQLRVLHVLGAL